MSLTIAQAVKSVLRKDPFYGLFLMGLNKRFDNSIQTAAVIKNGINTELIINEKFGNSLSDSYKVSILLHECIHLVLKHLGMQEYFKDKKRFNFAADCEVNSYIDDLPADAVTPEKFGFKKSKGTKWYYENLPDNVSDNYSLMDEHNGKDFENLSEAEKQLINNQVDHLVKEAAKQVQPGNVPSYLQDYVDGLLNKRPPIFNGRSYFRRLIGTIQDIELKKTRKKESNRFPGASGLKHKKKSNICVIVDTSGSVSNEELTDFFTEIRYVGKAGADITIIENDAAIEKIYKYNGKGNGEINGRGGTNFAESISGYNERFHDFNAVIFFTDGYADVDYAIAGHVIWVITSNGYRQKYPGKTIFIPEK